MELLILITALILLALAAIRFGHDSRDGFAPVGDIRSDLGYRDVVDREPAETFPAREVPTTRLADARP